MHKYAAQSREALAVILRKQAQDERRAEWIRASEQRARLLQQASIRCGVMSICCRMLLLQLLSHRPCGWAGERAA